MDNSGRHLTGKDLLESPLLGMWEGREETPHTTQVPTDALRRIAAVALYTLKKKHSDKEWENLFKLMPVAHIFADIELCEQWKGQNDG